MKVWRWCLVLLVFSACAAQPRALVGATAPPRDAARAVPSEVIDDANFALASAGALEGKAFDGWTPGSVAFVIVYPEEQWLFRSPGPLAGYDPRPFDSELGPVYRAPSLTLHDGKRGPNSPPRFFAHTSNFNGQVTFTIAAPSVAPFPASDWATVFVHEYFHAFQMLDERWKGDAPLLAPERRQRLVELYLGDEAVRTTVDRELEVYATLLQALDQGARPDCAGLPELLNARRERAELLRRVDPVLPQVEQALERMEGTARYVEESAYGDSAFAEVVRSRERDWKAAPADIQLRRALGSSRGEYFYATGYALARLLDACNPTWKVELAGRDLLELVTRKAQAFSRE